MAELSTRALPPGVATVAKEILDAALPIFAHQAWSWYDEHKGDVIFSKRIIFYTLTVKVDSFEGVLETLFGPRPTAAPSA